MADIYLKDYSSKTLPELRGLRVALERARHAAADEGNRTGADKAKKHMAMVDELIAVRAPAPPDATATPKKAGQCALNDCRKMAAYRVRLGQHDVIDVCADHARQISPAPLSVHEPIKP